jgi:FkbM family methyltransferase
MILFALIVQENKVKNIEVIPKGISNKADRIEIEISDFCLDSSAAGRKYTENYYTHKRMIDVISLDGFAEDMELDRIDFIKIDIEGLEELAIKGARKIINKYRPKWSVSSYHIDFNNEPQQDKLVKLLKESGYTIEEIKGFHIYAW